MTPQEIQTLKDQLQQEKFMQDNSSYTGPIAGLVV